MNDRTMNNLFSALLPSLQTMSGGETNGDFFSIPIWGIIRGLLNNNNSGHLSTLNNDNNFYLSLFEGLLSEITLKDIFSMVNDGSLECFEKNRDVIRLSLQSFLNHDNPNNNIPESEKISNLCDKVVSSISNIIVTTKVDMFSSKMKQQYQNNYALNQHLTCYLHPLFINLFKLFLSPDSDNGDSFTSSLQTIFTQLSYGLIESYISIFQSPYDGQRAIQYILTKKIMDCVDELCNIDIDNDNNEAITMLTTITSMLKGLKIHSMIVNKIMTGYYRYRANLSTQRTLETNDSNNYNNSDNTNERSYISLLGDTTWLTNVPQNERQEWAKVISFDIYRQVQEIKNRDKSQLNHLSQVYTGKLN